ncbi:MAG: transposase [Chloroflexota bacterium]
MKGAKKRAFQAEMVLKYCAGQARAGEGLFGWNRKTIETGLGEKRTGLICQGAQRYVSGRKRWEEKQPQAAMALKELAEAHAQQDGTFRTTIAYTRLTVKEALHQLRQQGFVEEELPSPRSMADILNRMGYRLRRVVKSKPQKN